MIGKPQPSIPKPARRNEGYSIFKQWKKKARSLEVDIYALYLSYRDPRVPWYAKLIIVCVVAYAFSPIDLIPDFIPVLGYLDDLILLPLGVLLSIKLIPPLVFAEHRKTAERRSAKNPKNWVAAGLILCFWFSVLIWLILGAFLPKS